MDIVVTLCYSSSLQVDLNRLRAVVIVEPYERLHGNTRTAKVRGTRSQSEGPAGNDAYFCSMEKALGIATASPK